MTLLLTNVPATHPAFDGQPLGSRKWDDAAWPHRAVMRLFGDLPDTAPRRHAGILFRVEPDMPSPDGTPGRVLVQSTLPPDSPGNAATTNLDDHLARFTTGDHVRLLLRANTAKTINCTCDGDGQRPPEPRPGVDPHTHRVRVADPYIPQWLRDRVDDAVNLDTTDVAHRLPDGTTTTVTVPDIKIAPCDTRLGNAQIVRNDLHATGTIHSPEALADLVQTGVGRAKAYGCGLLSIATS